MISNIISKYWSLFIFQIYKTGSISLFTFYRTGTISFFDTGSYSVLDPIHGRRLERHYNSCPIKLWHFWHLLIYTKPGLNCLRLAIYHPLFSKGFSIFKNHFLMQSWGSLFQGAPIFNLSCIVLITYFESNNLFFL